jgi:hypothetical protein
MRWRRAVGVHTSRERERWCGLAKRRGVVVRVIRRGRAEQATPGRGRGGAARGRVGLVRDSRGADGGWWRWWVGGSGVI